MGIAVTQKVEVEVIVDHYDFTIDDLMEMLSEKLEKVDPKLRDAQLAVLAEALQDEGYYCILPETLNQAIEIEGFIERLKL